MRILSNIPLFPIIVVLIIFKLHLCHFVVVVLLVEF